jgi:cell wall assembly regulator SMI1
MENRILNIYNELLKFSNSLLNLETSIIDNRIEDFENNIDYKLPKDFKSLIKKHNGFSLSGTEVYGIGKEFGENSLDKIYAFEHNQVENLMPNFFLPFSPDGYGNHYCIDLSRNENEICPIVFWQHDCIYEKIIEVETCNADFAEWISEVMIEWTLEEYNYNGTEK